VVRRGRGPPSEEGGKPADSTVAAADLKDRPPRDGPATRTAPSVRAAPAAY